MDELKRLIRERDALDARIAEIKHAMVKCGRAQLSFDGYSMRWRIMFDPIGYAKKPRKESYRVSLAFGNDAAKLIEDIPMIIKDLQGLYLNCKGQTDEDESEEDPTV